jgi:hypothetical protein
MKCLDETDEWDENIQIVLCHIHNVLVELQIQNSLPHLQEKIAQKLLMSK